MFLRDIVIYADKSVAERHPGGFVQRFHRETCCVAELYLAHLARAVKTEGIAKVQLTFTDSSSELPKSSHIQKLISVIALPWPFDFDIYARADRQVKKESVANAMYAAMLWLCNIERWDSAPFESAFTASLKQNLRLEGFLKGSWRSPSGRHFARIFFHYDIDEVELVAILYDFRSKRETARRRLGSSVPEMGCLAHLLHDARWDSDTEFIVRSTDFRRKVWRVDFVDVS